MHALDDGIGLEQRPAGVARAADDRAIVADAGAHIFTGRKAAGEFGDQPIFAASLELGEGA